MIDQVFKKKLKLNTKLYYYNISCLKLFSLILVIIKYNIFVLNKQNKMLF